MENTQDVQITINDLALIKSLIDVSCTRGAFKADEMKSVGEVYDKLTAFLTLAVKQAEEARTDSAVTGIEKGEDQ